MGAGTSARSRRSLAGVVSLAAFLGVLPVAGEPLAASEATPRATPPAGPAGLLARLPLRFEANAGQVDPEVRFVARCGNYALLLGRDEAVFALRRPGGPAGAASPFRHGRRPERSAPGAVVRMRFGGGAAATGLGRLPGVSHYLLGNDPSLWRTDVPAYGSVAYRGVRPGIDLVFRGDPRSLEYDLLVAPGADPGALEIAFEGADSVAVDAAGDLVLGTPDGELRHRAPVAWQDADGVRRGVPARWVLRGRNRAVLDVGERDPERPLVVDPKVVYATYLGGSGFDTGWAMTVDGSGSAHVAGWTSSTNFPSSGGYQTTNAGGTDDGFVAKLSADGSALAWATYIGGNGFDEVYGVRVDAGGAVYLGGVTASTNFPTQSPIQASFAGGSFDAFAVKLAAGGASLVYSTYYGGTGFDDVAGLALDSGGAAYICGRTSSTNLPLVNPYQGANGGGSEDAYVFKIDAAGTALSYATYLGGSNYEEALAIGVDGSGYAYVAGFTSSTNFPTVGAAQPGSGGGTDDTFITKLGTAGSTLVYSTYYGGSGYDQCLALAVDAAGIVTVGGITSSGNFPLRNQIQGAFAGGNHDAYLVRLNGSGTTATYATYIGGADVDEVYAVALDGTGAAYAGGLTRSTNFPTRNPIQAASGGGTDDAWLAKVVANGTAFEYATYFGGNGYDELFALSADSQGVLTAAGITSSTNFPVQGPYQSSFGGGSYDTFVARFTLVPPAAPTGLTATALSIAPVSLAWTDNSNNETGFEIERRSGASAFSALAVVGPGATAYGDLAVVGATTYTYRVRAVNADGVSAWSNEASATTLYLPAPPSGLVATPVSPSGIDLSWIDNSDNEIGFEVSRRLGTGPASAVGSPGPGATAFQDRGLLPDRDYTYRLRATGAAGPSPYSLEGSATTLPTLTLALAKGSLTDSPKPGKDKVKVSGALAFTAGSPDGALDAPAEGLTLRVGAAASPLVVVIPPNSPGWTEKKGKFTWKAPRGSATKVKVVLDTVKGTFSIALSTAEFSAPPSNPVRVTLWGGNDGGSNLSTWTVKKPGALKYP